MKIKSQATKTVYETYFKNFMDYYDLSKLSDLLKLEVQNCIIKYLIALREKGLSSNSISVRLNAIFHFYEMNDVVLNKKKIKKFKGEFSRRVIDRAYTHQEISKILQVSDLRMKVIIVLMASTGCRVGAIPLLKMRNLEKMDMDKNKNNTYKVTVYEGSGETYFTFTTPECSSFIDSYLEFREKNGEKINLKNSILKLREAMKWPLS
jgi:site-specific recombinase XerD